MKMHLPILYHSFKIIIFKLHIHTHYQFDIITLHVVNNLDECAVEQSTVTIILIKQQ